MNLTVIEQNGQRVLTTQQLAEAYGTDTERIRINFNRNKDRFVEGKHFFALTGQEKHEFINSYQIDTTWLKAPVFYIWTEKGAWLHAKSLNTDEAWEAYERLVDEYYTIKENALNIQMLSPQLQALISIELRQKQLEQELAAVRKEADEAKKQIAATSNEVTDLKRGMVDVNMPLRKQFNDAVRALSKKEQIGFDEAYSRVYELLGAQHHVDIKRRVENRKAKGDKNVKPLDIVEELNLLVPAIRLAKALAGVTQ
ncbi:ORF6N domain-containing protein [Anoxybacillus flavithermus]|uniref:Phage related anti-repressor protein n=1 Tax=Anoxybacillus flavithermus (strain DSM 21510 / WK1) TaxID=491915 RepID=B7GH67_ANOFW|nr:ORF6N domain-containing protein [Anoxybacillus flavithermus]ACJ33023.1 Phage related anti-repressor protein [Anoxybacillus flavithermus WK1]